MRIKDLIEQLSTFDPEARVYVIGDDPDYNHPVFLPVESPVPSSSGQFVYLYGEGNSP